MKEFLPVNPKHINVGTIGRMFHRPGFSALNTDVCWAEYEALLTIMPHYEWGIFTRGVLFSRFLRKQMNL
ncbi:hypothetical protein SPFM9_00083 [Salmonella phage SPFM9]|nr:hypothetical protein SPFM9_00083 [Salmonella phage SPFM9]